jgi:hypothetical protein
LVIYKKKKYKKLNKIKDKKLKITLKYYKKINEPKSKYKSIYLIILELFSLKSWFLSPRPMEIKIKRLKEFLK